LDGDLELTVLNTKRLTLTLCCPNDCPDFLELERDPEVMRFLNGGYAIDHNKTHPNATFLMPRGTENYVWTGRLNTNGAFVGWFCLWPETELVAELGYRVRRMHWGQGLASEGALALVNWGFSNAQYDKVFASTMAVNQGSRRVMEKIGLNYVRTIYIDTADPIPGMEKGEVVYELARSGLRNKQEEILLLRAISDFNWSM
jgi:RimJ/RimL family protein N-acetyltransferase